MTFRVIVGGRLGSNDLPSAVSVSGPALERVAEAIYAGDEPLIDYMSWPLFSERCADEGLPGADDYRRMARLAVMALQPSPLPRDDDMAIAAAVVERGRATDVNKALSAVEGWIDEVLK